MDPSYNTFSQGIPDPILMSRMRLLENSFQASKKCTRCFASTNPEKKGFKSKRCIASVTYRRNVFSPTRAQRALRETVAITNGWPLRNGGLFERVVIPNVQKMDLKTLKTLMGIKSQEGPQDRQDGHKHLTSPIAHLWGTLENEKPEM